MLGSTPTFHLARLDSEIRALLHTSVGKLVISRNLAAGRDIKLPLERVKHFLTRRRRQRTLGLCNNSLTLIIRARRWRNRSPVGG